MNNFLKAPALRLTQWIIGCAAAGLMAACGGGQPDQGQRLDPEVHTLETLETNKHLNPYAPGNATVALSAGTIAAFQEGARLNSAELEQIAKTGVIPKAFEGPLLGGATTDVKPAGRKSTATRTPVYRFFNRRTSAHFFTTSTTERDNVIATLPFMSYEGPAFYASASAVPGLSPVHRFYNIQTGVHFYTISESERAYVEANLPQFHYEGIAYFASTLEGAGYTPLYRFFYSAKGFHFYTNSLSERDNIIATLPQYHYEGVGYYVLGSDWRAPAIPHTGITSSQCHQAGSNVLVACSSAGALALSQQQDGHRSAINPMSYSGVPIFTGEAAVYPSTDCVKDNVTGLVWEGKTATGSRAGANLYTHLGNNNAGDASGYVNAANNSALCGFADWRLPTVEELHGIVNYGVTGSGPKITTGRFPNTDSGEYWTSEAFASAAGHFWTIGFSDGHMSFASAASTRAVRLVRGTSWSGPRYLFSTESYPGDGANNTAIDRKTGLAWRRCQEGWTWNGNACVVPGLVQPAFTHEAALARAATQTGWRLPNAKELASIADRTRVGPALDPVAFPGAATLGVWSSTPAVELLGYAWSLGTGNGLLTNDFRPISGGGARLVLDSP